MPKDLAEVIDYLTQWYDASHKGNRIPLFADQRMSDLSTERYYFNLLRSEWGDHSRFGELLFWAKHLDLIFPARSATSEQVMHAITEVAVITAAPLVSIDYRRSTKERTITLDSRRECTRVVQGTIHGSASMGPWRGLHRIPWRLVLGKHIAATIGQDRLRRLPSDQAIEFGNGIWILQTSVHPADSITDEGRAVERQIIDVLGPQFFACTERNELAKVKPEFPVDLIPQDSSLYERYGERLKPL
ncbi:hypothetical protein [Rubripirellula tenax]|uniref:hypothetical protein n=1 Tax=Rubripirellula tenax TaxID=2528015 RepID=UPI0011B7CDF9|nr:hypothetical protein [Rubripirellula tenax]